MYQERVFLPVFSLLILSTASCADLPSAPEDKVKAQGDQLVALSSSTEVGDDFPADEWLVCSSDTFSGGQYHCNQETTIAVLSPGEAIDDEYTIHYRVYMEVQPEPPDYGLWASITLAFDTRDNDEASPEWIERTATTYFHDGDIPINRTWAHETVKITAPNLDSGDEIRIRVKDYDTPDEPGHDEASVRGFNKSEGDPDHGVTYWVP